MSFTEKVDVLDLLINILKEHEEALDNFLARLENTMTTVDKLFNHAVVQGKLDKIEEHIEHIKNSYTEDTPAIHRERMEPILEDLEELLEIIRT